MQVPNVSYAQNNNNRYNQNFTSIRSFECTGLFKKYPQLANELVDTFKNNDEVMGFCSIYPTKVVLHAYKQAMDSVEAAICIFYKDKTKSGWAKFMDFFRGSEDKVIIHGWGNDFNLERSMKQATAALKAAMSPEDTSSELPTGLLNSHVKLAQEKLVKAFQEKLNAAEAKRLAEINKNLAKSSRVKNKSELETSIEQVINQSK